MWLATTKYYCEYFACYALLLEKENIVNKGTAKMLEKDKELRIDNQYYLKNKDVFVDYDKLRDFILKIKETINTITSEKIDEIRRKIKDMI